MTPTLLYDASCPVCTNYKRFLERRLGDRIKCEPGPEGAKDVTYKSADGLTFVGTKAIDRMTQDFPEIRDLSFLLPQSLKSIGIKIPGKVSSDTLKKVYKVSGAVRKGYQTIRKGCNCGGGKRK